MIQADHFQQKIRVYFNIVLKQDQVAFTLINPNIDQQAIELISFENNKEFKNIKKQEIIIIDNPIFDDQLLKILANGLSQNLTELVLDFSGCESLNGSGFLDLFEKISSMNLKKFHLDIGQVYQIDDLIMQGLSMLLNNLQEQLQDFFFDAYELCKITQDGYLLLSQSFSGIKNLKRLHLDLSSNVNLNEDSLELLFGNIGQMKKLESLTFRILDIQQIGGGSFFKLAQALINIKENLQYLHLVLSSFTNINHKAITEILISISKLKKLKELKINFSDLNLPTKIFEKLQISQTIKTFDLDVSCNRLINDMDIINLIGKIQKVEKISFNFDFCDKITDDSIEQLVESIFKNQNCHEFELHDQVYSSELSKNLIKKAFERNHIMNSYIRFKFLPAQQNSLSLQWKKYKQYQAKKRNTIYIAKALKLKVNEQKLKKQTAQDLLSIMV